MANATRELAPGAEYGRMAFDVFLMERWDYAADVGQDKKQWDSLARQYLAMEPRERYPYHMESARRMTSEYNAKFVANSDAIIINRVLPHFQTVQERNFCCRGVTQESQDPALLRTYYSDVNGQEQDEAHKVMIRDAILEDLVDKDGSWNDAALYDFGNDWQRQLLRVPEICDRGRHAREEQYRESEDKGDIEAPPAGDYDALERWLWSRRVATRLYVTDREAMESRKIKVFYLNTHGDAIWHHKFSADLYWNMMALGIP